MASPSSIAGSLERISVRVTEMMAIRDVVERLRTTRSDFAALFLQAQAILPIAQRKPLDLVTSQAADEAAFVEALTYAQARKFFDEFVGLVVRAGLEDGRIAEAYLETAAKREGNAPLQAMVDRIRGLANPEVWRRGYANGMRWTVKVFVDGAFQGTGVLIGPHLVLTAWHVVKDLFVHEGGDWAPDTGSATASRLTFELDDFLVFVGRAGQLGPNATQRVTAHPDWCHAFSTCHHEELQARLPADRNELADLWDYAVLRLRPPAGIERRWVPLRATAVVPKKGAPITVFQYLAGLPLKMDQATIEDADPPTLAIPRYRFLHVANTGNGSSGGPCFDSEFELFGLHQGVWTREGSGEETVINRGVPIVRVLEHVGELPSLDPAEAPIWHLGQERDYAPVVGTEGLQRIVWQAASGTRARVIVIQGDPGSGKTFCLDVLSRMLPENGHLKLILSAGVIGKEDAATLAATLCAAASAPLEPITPLPTYASTASAWLRDEVVVKIVSALDKVRRDRTVWICLRELNHFDVEGEHASDLLYLLYAQTRTMDWLRIVLDAPRTDLPPLVTAPLERAGKSGHFERIEVLERLDVAPLTLDDVATVLRRYVNTLEAPMGEPAIVAVAASYHAPYDDARKTDSAGALKTLVRQICALVQMLVSQQPNGALDG